MPLAIQCPCCAKRYKVKEELAGKPVRCQQCGATFKAASRIAEARTLHPIATAGPLVGNDDDPLTGIDLASLPAISAKQNPLGATVGTSRSSGLLPANAPYVSNPSGGPTDFGMRLICAGFLVFGVLLLGASALTNATQGWMYLAPLMLSPLLTLWGIAGLISPNVFRAAGKFGGHLPWHYRAIFWSLMAVWFFLAILIVIGLLAAGYRSDRPY